MAKAARVLSETLLHQGRFRLTRARVEVHEADGTVRELDHEIYNYKFAAAILLYDAARGLVLLVKQFRLGAFLADGALDVIEVCAGMLDADTPEVCARREAWEETGVRVAKLDFAFDTFMSPGGMTEKISCFTAPYAAVDRVGDGGGVDDDEHIELIEIPFAEALAAVERGEIRDAKTIALLYHARVRGLM
jgi:GDP-mannose pyrophosphatase NudK